MKSPSVHTLLKLLMLLIIFATIGPYIIVNILLKPSQQQLMSQHFRKASVYQQKTSPKKLNVSMRQQQQQQQQHPHIMHVPGGIQSLELPVKHNRWYKQNDDQLHTDKTIHIALNQTCNPLNYTTYQTQSYCLKDDDFNNYFSTLDHKQFCLKEGTEFFNDNGASCHCRSQWHGLYCSMPDIVYHSSYPKRYAYKYQDPPRRLINAFPFSYEFDLLESRFHEYEDLVDLYVIVESNYSASGQPKKRHLKEKLESGEYKEFQPKILYVSLDYFPRQAFYNGWVIDALLRNHMATDGLSRVHNLRPDDVFLLNDADELPKRELLMFLKLHYSYPEPVGMYLSHHIYGYHWLGEDILTHVFGACSMSMLAHVFKWQPYRLRSASKSMQINNAQVANYRYKLSGRVEEWSAGNGTMEGGKQKVEGWAYILQEDISQAVEAAAGWHCSWCFTPAGIKAKLEAAHWSDLPRWGAYPSKTSQDYIKNLTQTGMWFDDRTKLIPSQPKKAPRYILKNTTRFQHLLGYSLDNSV